MEKRGHRRRCKPQSSSGLQVIMRQLSLHASALNDAEYDLYTTNLANLDDTGSELDAQIASTSQNTQNSTTHDDAYYEGMKIGVREVRGWMRGRYSSVSPANIDAVCFLNSFFV